MFSSDYSWVSFGIVACGSEEFGTDVELLSTQPYTTNRSWECSRTATFPQEIILRFHTRIELDHVVFATKTDKNAPELEFHIGDGMSGSFLDVEYRLAGTAINASDKQVQMKLSGVGTYIKLVFTKAPKRSHTNPYGQVSIGYIKFWGRQTQYHKGVKNEQIPLVRDNSNIEKILVELGVPLDLLAWFDEDERNFEYAPIDSDTKLTLRDMEEKRNNAIKYEEFELLKPLTMDIKVVFDIGREIWKLQKELEYVVAKEDFNKAIEIKERLKKLIAKRDTYDALYETSRYEDMIVMARPSTAEIQDLEARLKAEDEYSRRRRKEELEEKERLQIVHKQKEDEEDKLKNNKGDYTPFWEKGGEKDIGKGKKKKPEKKKEEAIDVQGNNPFSYNEGDADLDSYFRPLIMNAGEQMKEIPIETLRRLQHLGYLNVFGAKVWTAAHSDHWRIREAACQAVLNFLEMPILDKYMDGKSKRLFLSAMEVARIACEDKLLQIYFIGLKIISTCLAPPICGKDVSPQIINKVLKEFLPILIGKISELNYRARDISLHTLLSLFRHPAAEIGNLIVCCLDIVDFEEDIRPKNNIPIEKQQWRIVLARLEIILHVLQEFGYDSELWNWDPVFKYLVVPSLFHSNVDVRLIAIELTIALYQLLGQDIRNAVDAVPNLKPNLLNQIYQRMDEIDAMQTDKKEQKTKLDNQLEQVDEKDEENLSNPGTAKGKPRKQVQFEMVTKDPKSNKK